MSPTELVDTIKAKGGVLSVEGNEIVYRIPKDVTHLLGELRTHKPEVVSILKARGGRIAAFPHCPRCASYALYRENNLGNYECLTCGMQDIEESTARRVQ